MSSLQRVLGANVRRIRRERGLTQGGLAKAIGRSADLVSRIERGDSAPSFETLEALCGALQAQPADLFGGPAGGGELGELVAGMSEPERAWAANLLRLAQSRPR